MRLWDDDISCVSRRDWTCRSGAKDGSLTRRYEVVLLEDNLFHRSPQVVVRTDDEELSSFIRALKAEFGDREWDSAHRWHCFTRRASVKQRDGHLQRLKGVMVLEKVLRWAQECPVTEYEVYLSGQVSVCDILVGDQLIFN